MIKHFSSQEAVTSLGCLQGSGTRKHFGGCKYVKRN